MIRRLLIAALVVAIPVTTVALTRTGDEPPPPDRPGYRLPASAETPDLVTIEDLTWPEIDRLVGEGTTTVIVPTGGTEQNGPHIVTGKHNTIVAEVAERIARRDGATLVAPVLAYVPEGDPVAGTGHMRFPGTISLPADVFEDVLEATADSLRAGGFTTIAFLGDSAWNQDPQDRVAARLSERWADEGVTVLNLRAAYDPERNGEHDILRAAGLSEDEIGLHAGPRDTSEALAVDPSMVREGLIAPDGGGDPADTGVDGDPTTAGRALGLKLVLAKIEAGVGALQAGRTAPND